MTDQTTPEDVPEDVEEIDESKIARSVSELVHAHPLVDLFGDSSRVLLIAALYTAPEPLNPARITDRAGLSPHTWYDNKEELLETGLVVQTGNAGNSPLYALHEDDERVEALDILSHATVHHQVYESDD